jgi:putative transposase
LLKTLKYRPNWPVKGLSSLMAGRQWMRLFEQAYNEEHLHDGINLVTPTPQHQGVDTELIAKYEAVYQRAKNLNPKRWSGDI